MKIQRAFSWKSPGEYSCESPDTVFLPVTGNQLHAGRFPVQSRADALTIVNHSFNFW
jgi:hypothetical protein